MASRLPLALALALAFVLGAVAARAHEREGAAGILVEPSSVVAGGTTVLAGSGLEPDGDRVLLLAGEGLIVEYGIIRTDAEGDFQKELTVPGHLPFGNYELRAIGDETLTTGLAVTAAAGSVESSTAEANKFVAPRDRTPVELSLLVALVSLVATLGGLLVWRAERFRGPADA